MPYVIGYNTPGAMPSPDGVFDADTFVEAKAHLLHEILWHADQADFEGPTPEGSAIALAAEDVNLWNGPDSVTVPEADIAFWIMEATE